MPDTAITQVPETPNIPQFTAQELAQIAAFKEAVFQGIRWSGWIVDRDGNDMATMAIIYALEPGKPIGFNKRLTISSVASPAEHLAKLQEKLVEFVEEFTAANLGAPNVEIVSIAENSMFDESPMTRAGLLMNELSGANDAEYVPEAEVLDDKGNALTDLEAARVRNEVMTREFGVPTPTLLDVVRDRLKRRL